MEKLQNLTNKECVNIEGGLLGPIAIAFWGGVAYGYIKEKYNSGQW
jgi:hypothetical protein